MYVDWVSYYDAAKKCHDLANDLRAADKPVHTAVKDQGAGMAGDAPGCVEWAKAYDSVAQRTLQTCTNLSDALTNFGNVLYASGYNYGTSNNSDPAPPRPTITAMAEHKVTIPSATTATSGVGVKKDGEGQFFDDLLSDITNEFKKLPNADIDALAAVTAAWSTFAASEALSGAKARIATISQMFDDMDQIKNRELIQQHLNTIGSAADTIVLAAQHIAAPVGEFNTGIHSASQQIDTEMTDLKIEAGFTIGLAAVGSIFSLGGTAVAAAVRVGALVLSAMTKIRKVLNSADLLKILGFAGVFGGAVTAITAFDKVPDTEKVAIALAEIIAMKVLIDDSQLYENLPVASAIPLGGLTDIAEEYIRRKHVEGGAIADADPDKSTFNKDQNLDDLIDGAEDEAARGPNKYGNYERDVDAGTTIGQSGGKPTSRYKVITDKWGTVTNMFPIP
ncbi:hypothetical protein ACFO5K_24530 [Nocardia halotolerans]|uniref:Uncharacterized protein n=1 Tax=Nocardia halotolerans TaxID=1755878 RepID=A0ABV8VN68_9NOCA